ncbi:hypothetical protein VNO80_27973 [Phaseolus coccineus]|uniref:Uncharacterized protein n=1 Tax=Phaseolus coccineus TaxID=3886 RepID=A0AAN9QHR5_PHACN
MCSTFCSHIPHHLNLTPMMIMKRFSAPISPYVSPRAQAIPEPPSRVGFLGIGIMGSPMAHNLLKAGIDLTVWNRTKSKCDPLISLGAKYKPTPEEVAASCDVTFAMLADPQSALDVACGKHGATNGMGPGKGYVDVSTVDGDTSKLISAHIKSTGALFLEAPVSGSKKPAEDGQLIFLTAGDKNLYETVASLLDIMGKSKFYLGNVGNGAAMKLVVNMIMGSMMASFSEGLLLGEKVGLDPDVLVQVVSQGAISAPMYSTKGPSMIQSLYPTAFPLKHQQKDLRLALGLAESVSQPTPIAAAANELYKVAKSHGLSDQDFSAVIEALKSKFNNRKAIHRRRASIPPLAPSASLPLRAHCHSRLPQPSSHIAQQTQSQNSVTEKLFRRRALVVRDSASRAMKVKKQRRHRKALIFYTACCGFRKPFKILCDGTFVYHLLVNKITPADTALGNILSADVKLYTTSCILAELKRLGRSHTETLEAARKLIVARCEHDRCVTAVDCIKEVVGENNSEHFFVASQDTELRKELQEVPGVPLIYGLRNALFLESPSAFQRQYVKTSEEERSHVTEKEYKILNGRVMNRQTYEEANKSITEIREKVDSGDETINFEAVQKDKPLFKRKRAKCFSTLQGPNPLSCKKKKIKTQNIGLSKESKGDSAVKRCRNRKRKRSHKKEMPTQGGS